MTESSQDLSQRSLMARKLRDAALVLPFLGIFLFLTPVPAIFSDQGSEPGIPAIFTYIFGIWLALIVICAIISRRILSQDTSDRSTGKPK